MYHLTKYNIDPENFSPYSKNPMIARFFNEIGRVDELGSGVRNTYKYCGLYTPGTEPEFIESDDHSVSMFKNPGECGFLLDHLDIFNRAEEVPEN